MVDRIIQKGLSPHSDSVQDISIIPDMMLTNSRIELDHDLPLSPHQLKFTSLSLSMLILCRHVHNFHKLLGVHSIMVRIVQKEQKRPKHLLMDILATC